MVKTEIVIPLTADDVRKIDNMVLMCQAEVKLRKASRSFAGPITDRVGYAGECAFAKWLNVPFTYKPYNRLSTDVLGYQIKTTSLATGSLIMKPHNPAGTYVLAILNGDYESVTLKGWALSHDIKQECYWRNDVPKPAWFMPQKDLWSMNELTETAELAAHNGTF
jgi:hypothetical protein